LLTTFRRIRNPEKVCIISLQQSMIGCNRERKIPQKKDVVASRIPAMGKKRERKTY